jgi:hypothetical protein
MLKGGGGSGSHRGVAPGGTFRSAPVCTCTGFGRLGTWVLRYLANSHFTTVGTARRQMVRRTGVTRRVYLRQNLVLGIEPNASYFHLPHNRLNYTGGSLPIPFYITGIGSLKSWVFFAVFLQELDTTYCSCSALRVLDNKSESSPEERRTSTPRQSTLPGTGEGTNRYAVFCYRCRVESSHRSQAIT